MRKLTYYVACSIDRFIAREDGSFDFYLTQGQHLEDLIAMFPEAIPAHVRTHLGITGDNRRFDTVLMGRKTYEAGLADHVTSPYPHLKQYVVSQSMAITPDLGIELIKDDPAGAVARLKEEPGKDIWLCGGGRLASSVFAQIDELILKVNPVILGAGIPLFDGAVGTVSVTMRNAKVYDNGFMLVHYKIQRQDGHRLS